MVSIVLFFAMCLASVHLKKTNPHISCPHYSFRENDTTAGYTIYRGGVIFAETVPFHLGGVDLTSLSKKDQSSLAT